MLDYEAVIAKIVSNLSKKDGIWCVARDYNIDSYIDDHEINEKLVYANTDELRRRLKLNDSVNMAKYSVQTVQDNYMNYLYDEMLRERNLVY